MIKVIVTTRANSMPGIETQSFIISRTLKVLGLPIATWEKVVYYD